MADDAQGSAPVVPALDPFTAMQNAAAAAAAEGKSLEPPKSAIEAAVEAAQKRIAEGKPLIPQEAESAADVAARQASEHAAAEKAKADEAAKLAGEKTSDEKAAEEAEAAKKAAEVPVEGEEEDAEKDLTILLPGRRPDDDEFEIVVDSPEVAERLAQLKNGYMRGEETRQREAEVIAKLAEIDDFRELVQTDPVGLVKQVMPAWAQEKLLLSLLTDEAIWVRMRDKVIALDDPSEFQVTKAQAEAEQYKIRDQLVEGAKMRRVQQDSARAVVHATMAMAPESLTPELKQQFGRAALEQLKGYADRTGALTIAPDDVPAILSSWMRANGMDPVAAAAQLATAMAAEQDRSNGKPGKKAPAAPAAKVPGAPPAKTGKEFVDAQKTKRAAAAAAPAGAGAPASGLNAPPAGQSIEERLKWFAKEKGIPFSP